MRSGGVGSPAKVHEQTRYYLVDYIHGGQNTYYESKHPLRIAISLYLAHRQKTPNHNMGRHDDRTHK